MLKNTKVVHVNENVDFVSYSDNTAVYNTLKVGTEIIGVDQYFGDGLLNIVKMFDMVSVEHGSTILATDDELQKMFSITELVIQGITKLSCMNLIHCNSVFMIENADGKYKITIKSDFMGEYSIVVDRNSIEYFKEFLRLQK